MIVQRVPVEKLILRDLERLDPIHVYLEDTAPGQGSLVLRCYDRSWTAGWNAMGKATVREFIRTCDNDYLANCLSRGISSTGFSGEALQRLAVTTILKRRRGHSVDGLDSPLDAEEARDLYNRVLEAGLHECTSLSSCPYYLMEHLFGDEWWFMAERAVEPNPDYLYLCRILDAVREGLTQAEECPRCGSSPDHRDGTCPACTDADGQPRPQIDRTQVTPSSEAAA